MKKKLFAVALLGAISLFGQFSVGIRIGPPPAPRVIRVQPPRPGPEYTWIDGYWYASGDRYRWHDGYWTRPAYPAARWVAPRYEGDRFYDGYWDGDRGQFGHDHRWDRQRDNRDYNRYRDHDNRDHDRDHEREHEREHDRQ